MLHYYKTDISEGIDINKENTQENKSTKNKYHKKKKALREHLQDCYSTDGKEKAKEHYEDKKESFQKKLGKLSNKQKRKRKYRRNQYKSMSKEHKQKIIEYRKHDIKVF